MSLSFRGTVLRSLSKASFKTCCNECKLQFSRNCRFHVRWEYIPLSFCIAFWPSFRFARCQHFALLALVSRKIGWSAVSCQTNSPNHRNLPTQTWLGPCSGNNKNIHDCKMSHVPIQFPTMSLKTGRERQIAKLEITNRLCKHMPPGNYALSSRLTDDQIHATGNRRTIIDKDIPFTAASHNVYTMWWPWCTYVHICFMFSSLKGIQTKTWTNMCQSTQWYFSIF